MDKDKAIRSAKLTAAGILDKARAKKAVQRAGGQIAPSKFMPEVPRQVHAEGGAVGYVPRGWGQLQQLPAARLPTQSRGSSPIEQIASITDAYGSLRNEEKKPENRDIVGSHMDANAAPPRDPATAFSGADSTSDFDWYKYAVGGAKAREDSFSRLDPGYASRVAQLVQAADQELGPRALTITSAYRSPELQAQLYADAIEKYGSEEAARKWVAPPGLSKHNSGMAVDFADASGSMLRDANSKEAQWIKANAARFGLDVPMSWEPWQVELAGSRGRANGGAVTDSDEFRNWFGSSVTHTDGAPHVFYTGTSKDKDFTSHNVGRHGAWFTRNPDIASEYAEQNDSQGYKWDGGRPVSVNTASRVIPAYVKAENPYTGELPDEYVGNNYKALQSAWFDTLRAKGHDAWMPESHGGSLVVALKEPQQIKSIFNNGKFDPKQKHMNKADGGTVDGQPSPKDPATRPQAGEFPGSGGVRGGAGLLQAPNETSLEGLPTKVRIPLTGETITASHDPRIRQVARDYMASAGLPYSPPTKYAKVDPSRAARIGNAYEAMEDNADDPLTKSSYAAMIRETMAQYKTAKDAGFKAEFWHPDKQEDPYGASPRLATEDIRNNHHMWVYPTHAGYGSGDPISEEDIRKNPMLQLTGETWNGIPVTVNDVFRAVHDYYGHAKEGLGFRHDGEENAWRAHASMFTPLARMAMTTETRGQNSWLNFGPHGADNRTARTEDTVFAPQKVGILPHWAHHEGAEDFMKPEEIEAMGRIREQRFAAGGSVESRHPVWNQKDFSPEKFASALKSSPYAPTLTQYDPGEVRDMMKSGKFNGFKLSGKDAYFAIKHGVDYGQEYGFHHPELTGNEKALVGVVNNDRDARGVGDSLMKEALKRGVTALDAYAVPSDRHPRGFLPEFYGKYGFKELGRIPFEPKYVTPEQFSGMKEAWKSNGWDEKRHPMPDVVVMKRGTEGAPQSNYSLGEKFRNGGAVKLIKRHEKKASVVDSALAMTRRFTKDGAGATMALKSKG